MAELDRFDIAILEQLQRDGRASSGKISVAVGLSPTAVQRRIKQLREHGVIVADLAVVNPQSVGRGLTAIVEVEMYKGGADVVDEFKRRARKFEAVQQCYYVSGGADFVLIITAKDMADYERLTQKLFFESSHVHKFHTSFVMDSVKVGLQIPLK